MPPGNGGGFQKSWGRGKRKVEADRLTRSENLGYQRSEAPFTIAKKMGEGKGDRGEEIHSDEGEAGFFQNSDVKERCRERGEGCSFKREKGGACRPSGSKKRSTSLLERVSVETKKEG